MAVIIGLGHPRCGTGFATHLLIENGFKVAHEKIAPDGIVSWMQAARRGPSPWGTTFTEYPENSKIFLVARSPLAALNSVATESREYRSIGFRSQVIWDRCGIDIFAWNQQTSPPRTYDFFGWGVMSLAYWYEICFQERPEMIFRVDREQDDQLLSNFLGKEITREGKKIWRNEKPGIKKLEYSIEELARVPKQHLNQLINVSELLGYPDDAEIMRRFL